MGISAQTWFIAGTVPLLLAGSLHALLALIDSVRPTFFAPVDANAKPAMDDTGVRLVRMFGASGVTPSTWRMWLGINVSHGLGVSGFGLMCLLIATHDFDLVEQVDALRLLPVAFCAAYLALSLRFWFYGPTIVTATATTCFTFAAVLAA
jgi:hypothetical protein